MYINYIYRFVLIPIIKGRSGQKSELAWDCVLSEPNFEETGGSFRQVWMAKVGPLVPAPARIQLK